MGASELRAVVIEDERVQRRELVAMLRDRGVEVTGQAGTVAEAVFLLDSDPPDVVFLDIRLGGESGFDVLERVTVPCEVVFVTAYDAYAIRAFEVNAIDYLLKPVREERLSATLEKLKAGRDGNRPGGRVPKSQGLVPGSEGDSDRLTAEDRLFVRGGDRWRFVPIRRIVAIEAVGDFTRIRLDDETSFLLSRSMRDWETRLPQPMFARIHRSTIVNLECVDRVEEWSNRAFNVYVAGRSRPYRMSRRFAAKLRQ